MYQWIVSGFSEGNSTVSNKSELIPENKLNYLKFSKLCTIYKLRTIKLFLLSYHYKITIHKEENDWINPSKNLKETHINRKFSN